MQLWFHCIHISCINLYKLIQLLFELCFIIDHQGIYKYAKEILSSDDVPHCLAYSLQVVKFEKVNGDKHELLLAKYFIENGMMIEELGFSIASQRLDQYKVAKEFKEMVFPFKKRSIFFYCLSDD